MSDPLVTLLCPTRGRPKSFDRSIQSLVDTATDHTRLHVLAYLDEDDNTKDQYTPRSSVFYFTGPRYGYANLHLAIRERLLPHIAGKWVFLWNDDAIMNSQRWDDVLMEVSDDLVINPRTNHEGWYNGLNVFPIIPTKWVQLVGWSQNGANDTWWQIIGGFLDRHRQTPEIDITHDRDDLTGGHQDDTRAGNDYDPSTFYTLQMYANMGLHAGRIYQKFYA
jgi:hypothetical protein